MSKLQRYCLIGLLGLLVAFNLYRFYTKHWSFADPIDLRGLYLGSELLAEGEAIYSDSIAAERWKAHKRIEGFESNTDFGEQWVSIMVYPPWAFTLVYPLGQLSWKQARTIWWGLCAVLLILFMWLIYQWQHDPWLLGLIVAFKGTAFALMLGQPMLLVTTLLALSVRYRSRPILAGIFLGLAMMKFTLAIPFGLWFLLQKDVKLVVTAALVALVTLLPSLLVYEDILSAYMSKAADYYNMIYQPGSENIYTYSNSELTILLDYYWDRDVSLWKRINGIGQVIAYLGLSIAYLKQRIDAPRLLLGLLLISFLFSYHLVYDALIFVIPLAMLRNKKHQWMGMALLLLLSLPINHVMGDFTLFKFHYPLIVALAAILYTFVIDGRKHPTS